MPDNLVDIQDLLPDETEAVFQARLLRYASIYGFSFRYHTFNSRRSTAGYPDLTLLNPDAGAAVLVEVKTDKGKLTQAQRDWLYAIANCGIDAALWRPRMEDEIVGWLSSPKGPAPTDSWE